jgi:hypothetical protein
MEANMRLFNKEFVFFQKHHNLFARELIVLAGIPRFGISSQNQLLLSIKIFGSFCGDATVPLLHADIARTYNALDRLPLGVIKNSHVVAQDGHLTALDPNALLKEKRLRLTVESHPFSGDVEHLSGPPTIRDGHP